MKSPLLERFVGVARERSEHPAILDDSEEVSWGELGRRVDRVAARLRERGYSGERVAMLVTQGSRWVEAFWGIARAGATVVPLSHLHPEAEQRWFTDESRAVALVVSADLAERARSFAGERPVLDVDELCADGAPDVDLPDPEANEPVLIMYTSGTTGKPKGALISHTNLEALARLVGEAWNWRPEDRLLHSLPLHHLHGLGISLFVALLAGSSARMLPKFDAERMWELMGECTVLMGVPTMHKRLLDVFDERDEPTRERWRANAAHLRLLTSGSAALPSTVGTRWQELTGAYPLERFGMTEIGVGTTNPVGGERRPGSCGQPLPGMQIRIVDEAGVDVREGESGEIWIKGPSVFLGYDRNPKATEAAFSGDGWFKSGDTATWLPDRYVKILGRTSVDILKSGGYKLSALEIEEVLREHDAIADVAVVGVPDETWGEMAVAAVIARPGREREVAEPALRDWAKERIASYKVPKRVFRLDDFPRNPVGKVLKPELGKLLRARLEG